MMRLYELGLITFDNNQIAADDSLQTERVEYSQKRIKELKRK